uniref:Conotoxin Em12.1 n=1 Tax=Conus emaciatus TaxID=89442 RepID=C8BLR8_CONEM|nr:conotoxin Em12.1 [Conus emaciatus]
MFGHTSVSFLLLSIMALGMVPTVICWCSERVSDETCVMMCRCLNHECCPLPPPSQNRCMPSDHCDFMSGRTGRRRSTQMLRAIAN